MAVIRGTLIFEGGSHGWVEGYYWTGPAGNLAAATTALDFIAQKRAVLLGAENFIKARRVSVELDDANLPVRGDAQLRKNPVYIGTQTQPSAVPGVSLQLRWENANGSKHRNSYLRGIWDSVESADGVYLPGSGPGWGGAMSAFISSLLGGAGVITGWLSRVNIAPVDSQVLGYTEEATGQILFTFSAATFAPGDIGKRRHIRISGLNAPVASILNREWIVTVKSTATAETIIPVSAFDFTSPGKVKVFDYGFQPAVTILEEGVVFRAPGRPTLARRGRSPRRAMG